MTRADACRWGGSKRQPLHPVGSGWWQLGPEAVRKAERGRLLWRQKAVVLTPPPPPAIPLDCPKRDTDGGKTHGHSINAHRGGGGGDYAVKLDFRLCENYAEMCEKCMYMVWLKASFMGPWTWGRTLFRPARGPRWDPLPHRALDPGPSCTG